MDNEIVMMNTMYKDRFPKVAVAVACIITLSLILTEFQICRTQCFVFIKKATHQMERWLKKFIDEQIVAAESGIGDDVDLAPDAVAIVRFVRHQLTELARDC